MRLPGIGTVPRTIRRQATRQGWTSRVEPRNGGLTIVYDVASLPVEARAMLAARSASVGTPACAGPNLDTLPASHRELTLERVRLVGMVHTLVAQGSTRCVAEQRAAQAWCCEHDALPAPRTVRRWVDRCKGQPDSAWFALLVPQWKSSSTRADCHTEAWTYFRSDYLRAEEPPYTKCYERMVAVARDRGWAPIPSLHYFIRRLNAEVPTVEQLLLRKGEDAVLERYPAQERDVSNLYAMWGWNADGHKLDIMVEWPDGEIGRPILVGFQDIYSRRVVGWRVDKTESAELVRLALSDAVEAYGIPEHLFIDNGRAFWTKVMTGGAASRFRFPMREEDPMGVLKAIGITAHAVKPFSGKSKPIERAWRDLCDTVSKDPHFAGAYTGPSTTSKPSNYGKRLVRLEELLQALPTLIDVHNAREGRRTQTAMGRSFAATFAASLEGREVRQLTDDKRRMLLLQSTPIMVRRGRGHIEYGHNRYWTDSLIQHEGKKIVVRFDPDDLHAGLFAYRLDGTYIGYADCIGKTGFADERAKKEHNRSRARFLKGVKKAAELTTTFTQRELSEMHLGAHGVKIDVTHTGNVIRITPRRRIAEGAHVETKVRVEATAQELADQEAVDDLIERATTTAEARLRVK